MPIKPLVCAVILSCIFSNSDAATNIWTPPYTLSATTTSIIPADSPIAIDTHSNAVVGWLNGPYPTTTEEIFSAYLPGGTTTWDAPELIFTDTPPEFPSYPLMFTDVDDNQTVVFGMINTTDNTAALGASRRPSGTSGWPTPTRLDFQQLTGGGNAQTGSFGNILGFVALTDTFAPPYTLVMSTLPAGTSDWSTPLFIDEDNSAQPVLATGVKGGHAVLVWRTDTPTLGIHSKCYSFDDGQLTNASDIALPIGTTDVINLFVKLNSHGQALALFTVTDGSSNTVYTAVLPAGSTTWSAPILLSNPANNGVALSSGIDEHGNAVLLWAELTPSNDGYIFSADLPLNGISNVIQLQGPVPSATYVDPSSNVSVDSFGNAVAVWGVVAGGVSSVYADTKAVGGSWTTPVALSLTGRSPKVALSNQETAVAVWIDSVTGYLLTSTNLSVFDLQPPSLFTGKVVKNRFLNSSSYALKLHWEADPLVHIDRFEIRHNGELVETVAGTERKGVVYLPSKSLSGTYTLTSIATNGNASAPVALTLE